ncbi:hypothetical protein D3C86_1661230 [compost metagenome]
MLTPTVEQLLLVLGLTRHLLAYFVGHQQFAALDFRTEAFDPQQQGQAIGLGLADVGSETSVIQTQQGIADIDDLPLADEQFGNDTAFQVLDFLQARGRNCLAIATGDLLDHGEMRPQQTEGDECNQAPDGQANDPRRILDQRLADFRQRLVAHAVMAAEIRGNGLTQALLGRFS